MSQGVNNTVGVGSNLGLGTGAQDIGWMSWLWENGDMVLMFGLGVLFVGVGVFGIASVKAAVSTKLFSTATISTFTVWPICLLTQRIVQTDRRVSQLERNVEALTRQLHDVQNSAAGSAQWSQHWAGIAQEAARLAAQHHEEIRALCQDP